MEMSFSMIKARIGQTPDGAERRRTPRFSVEVDARVRELGAEGVEARVLNISESGFMAETDGHFDVGTRVWLMLPGREEFYGYVKDRGSQDIELYNLESDIGEKKNLAKERPEIVEEMLALAKAFRWPEKLYDNPIRIETTKPAVVRDSSPRP